MPRRHLPEAHGRPAGPPPRATPRRSAALDSIPGCKLWLLRFRRGVDREDRGGAMPLPDDVKPDAGARGRPLSLPPARLVIGSARFFMRRLQIAEPI